MPMELGALPVLPGLTWGMGPVYASSPLTPLLEAAKPSPSSSGSSGSDAVIRSLMLPEKDGRAQYQPKPGLLNYNQLECHVQCMHVL